MELRLYHSTDAISALRILANGFWDGPENRGVLLSDSPDGCGDGAALVVFYLDLEDADLLGYEEPVEEGKPYRRWRIPAANINPGMQGIERVFKK